MRRVPILVLALSFILAYVGPTMAKPNFFSPLVAVVKAVSVLNVEPDCCPSTSLIVTASDLVTEADLEWVYIPLTVEREDFKEVRVCYEVLSPVVGRTYISQIRLTQMNRPNTALVRHDDATILEMTSPTCVTSDISPILEVRGTITLALRVVFGSTEDAIKIGGIRLR